jgi:hypothetical protein
MTYSVLLLPLDGEEQENLDFLGGGATYAQLKKK